MLPVPRFRIQKSPDRRPFAGSPKHIAGYHVFRRLSMPRHPPYTLSSLITFIDHRHPRSSLGTTTWVLPRAGENGRQPTYMGYPTSSDRPTDNESLSPKRCSAFPTPTEKPKSWGGNAEFLLLKETLNLYSLVKDQPCSGPHKTWVS